MARRSELLYASSRSVRFQEVELRRRWSIVLRPRPHPLGDTPRLTAFAGLRMCSPRPRSCGSSAHPFDGRPHRDDRILLRALSGPCRAMTHRRHLERLADTGLIVGVDPATDLAADQHPGDGAASRRDRTAVAITDLIADRRACGATEDAALAVAAGDRSLLMHRSRHDRGRLLVGMGLSNRWRRSGCGAFVARLWLNDSCSAVGAPLQA